MTGGEIAYNAYCQHRNWKSFNGDPLPSFADSKPDIREGWEKAAYAVLETGATGDIQMLCMLENHPELEPLIKIGLKWTTDSRLEEWFPLTAEELTRLRAQVEVLQEEAASQRADALRQRCQYLDARRQVKALKAEVERLQSAVHNIEYGKYGRMELIGQLGNLECENHQLKARERVLVEIITRAIGYVPLVGWQSDAQDALEKCKENGQ